jgi:hypothetical protein
VVPSGHMKRLIIQQKSFSRKLDELIISGKLFKSDYDDFEWDLVQNPKTGEVIPGLASIRKTRLKSSSKGKRGGFRVDYLDIPESEILHLLVIYGKNVKDDLSSDEKKILASIAKMLKEGAKKYG